MRKNKTFDDNERNSIIQEYEQHIKRKLTDKELRDIESVLRKAEEIVDKKQKEEKK